ncbi:MAG TPA: rhodanese-like domain-containing protein [Thermoanaerobaculia bacterium]|jgi:rhodanese-related sulfurtransferase
MEAFPLMRKAAVLMMSSVLVAAVAGAQMKVTQTAPATGTTTKQSTATPMQTQQTEEQQLAAAKRIDRNEAQKLVKAGKAVFVDVRSKASFDKGHLPGAVNIPLSIMRANMVSAIRQIPPGKMVITYCACIEEHTAAIAVLDMNRTGFKNAAALKGGWNEWLAAKMPIER